MKIMKITLVFLLLLSSLFASFGQILFKLGADKAATMRDFVNLKIFLGLLLYIVSTMIWIYALSSAKLNTVYAFTALTFAMVYVFSFALLKEKLNLYGIAGVIMVLLGLYLILSKGRVN